MKWEDKVKRDKGLIILTAIPILLAMAEIALAIINPDEFMAAQSKVRLTPIGVIVPAIMAGR